MAILGVAVMVLGALFSGFGTVLRKPAVLIPAGIAAIVQLLLFFFAQLAILEIVWEALFGEGFAGVSFAQLPAFAYSLNADTINILLGLFFLSLLAGSWMVLSLSRLAVESRKAKPSAFGAMAFATARLPRLLALAVFEFIALALFCLALFFSVLLLAWIDWLGIVAAFFFGIIGFFAWLVFSFALPAMAAADASLKDSLKASWAFVSKHVISAVALMLLLGFLSAVVNEIGGLLSNVFAGIEALSIAIVFVFLAFALAFSNLSVAFFFLGKEAAGPEAFASKRDRRRHERRFGR